MLCGKASTIHPYQLPPGLQVLRWMRNSQAERIGLYQEKCLTLVDSEGLQKVSMFSVSHLLTAT
jgi:hypothetical protein